MPDIQFESGVFHVYRATDQINIGAIDTTTAGGYNVSKDETLRYDGSTIILKDGREFDGITQLRGAINAGWFVPEADTKTTYRPKSANIEVREVEQRGLDQARKSRIVTEDHGEQTVGSVEARKKDRQAKYEAVSRGLPPMESEAGKAVAQAVAQTPPSPTSGHTWLAEMIEFNEGAEFSSGDDEMDAIAVEISEYGNAWLREKLAEHNPEFVEDDEGEPEDVRSQLETDMLSLFSMLDDMEVEKKPAHKKAPAKKAVKKAPAKKFAVQGEERLSMPIKSGDDSENAGEVVAEVQSRTVVEEEQTITLNVAPAKPAVDASTPEKRLGASGAIVVDDQRNMGAIKLSSEATRVDLDASAKVTPNTTGTVRMDNEAQVGGRRKVATPQGDQDGVAVGRVLSPTHTEFTATDANTNSTAVERVAQGKTLKVEHFEREAKATATGDVQEARSGEDLDELLPEAATPPAPEKKTYLPPEEDPAYKAVQALIPDFKWNKDRRWQDRVEDAMKHVENPPYLKGIIAVETDTVSQEIKKRLASYLAEKSDESAENAEE
jgi:hypothetical protein